MVALGNMVETTVVVKKFGRVVGGREGYLNPEGEGTAAGRIWRETEGRGGLPFSRESHGTTAAANL
jgi:hypothetical protein